MPITRLPVKATSEASLSAGRRPVGAHVGLIGRAFNKPCQGGTERTQYKEIPYQGRGVSLLAVKDQEHGL